MSQTVAQEIASIKRLSGLENFNEKTTVNKVVLALLVPLGWNPFNESQVKKEYRVGDSDDRIDVCLNPGSPSAVFIEVKKPKSNLDHHSHQKQLINYCLQDPSIGLAVLTNGKTWCFYLPRYEGARGPDGRLDVKAHRFARIDIMVGAAKSAERLTQFLGKGQVDSGEAVERAKKEIESKEQDDTIYREMTKAWNQMVAAPSPGLTAELIELTSTLIEALPEVSEAKPSKKHVTQFLKKHQSKLHL